MSSDKEWTLDEIERALTETEFPYKDYYGNPQAAAVDWPDWWHEDVVTPAVVEGLGEFTIEETVGGEGEGDHAHVVLRLTDPAGNVRFFKKDGYYSSYYGSDMDGYFAEVRPVEKTITVFE